MGMGGAVVALPAAHSPGRAPCGSQTLLYLAVALSTYVARYTLLTPCK